MKKMSALLILASAFLLSGCVSDQSDNFAHVHRRIAKQEAENLETFNVTTDLNAEKQIHTAAQKTYLEYDGNYKDIPTDQYPDGLSHISDPEPVNLAWEFSVPAGKTLSRYSVKVGKKADLSDGYVINGTTASSLDIYNSYLGDNYFQIIANYSDNTTDSSVIKKYTVENVYPRNLKIDGMTNCRDMGGGRTLEDGGTIKQGLIFRTSGTNSWGNGKAVVPDNITNDGKAELLQRLGCKTEINVNNSGSNQVGVQNFVDAYMWYDGGKHHLFRNSEPIKKVFHALSDENNYPVFYHCRIGTDRTGLCAILISGLLGVSENEIYQDYLFSNFGNIQEKRFIGEAAGRDNILNYINDLKAFPGEKFQNKIYNYLLSIGVPASELNSVINILTEGNKAQGNDNAQQVVLADDFSADGTEKQTSTSAAHPASYYTLTADSYVTASFSPSYSGEATVVAYLGSTNDSSTKKVNEAITVSVGGTEMAISDDLTFYEAGFGQGSSRTYYAGVQLGTVQVKKGNLDIDVFGVADDLNIGAISLIPNQKVTPSGGNDGAAKKGCFGSITAASTLIGLVAFAGVGVLVFRKKKEQ